MMYSGMFTHSVKPALTSKQAKELFGLLGYQPSGPGEEEELRLCSKPVNADVLLQLACAFFTARIECQLLLSAVVTLGGTIKSELQLIQDRKGGHSLHVALDNAFKMLEAVPVSSNNNLTDVDAPDIYTDDSLASPPSLPYIPPKESALSFSMSHSNTSQAKREKNENTSQAVCFSTAAACDQISKLSLTQQSKFENEKQIPAAGAVSSKGRHVCNCLQSSSSCPGQCIQCEEIHDESCPCFKHCQKQGHDVRLKCQLRTAEDQPQGQEKTSKNSLKQHRCMKSPTNDFFLVCHDCHYIHDFKCNEFLKCESQGHNIQPTGKLQLPQEEKTAAPERHACLKEDDKYYVICSTCNKYHNCLCTENERCQNSGHDVKYLIESNQQGTTAPSMPVSDHDCSTGKLQLPPQDKMTEAPERHWCLGVDDKYYVICNTCNKYHDHLCPEKESCQKSGHDLEYPKEPNKQETQALSMLVHYHECCSSRQPDLFCLACRIVHSSNCSDSLCKGHEMKFLKPMCTECLNHEFCTLCGYCFKQYCKNCWFKNPMQCKCGKPLSMSTNV
ncbi:spermatogenesis associated 2-like isoform X2 [Trichomycterus rosablanca]|uniref:spermatogenesis associated 2-like isoform X2 n=1 Tax=Trichomycterus rosablanca TaxID=2290929 RepID=UPI002F352431